MGREEQSRNVRRSTPVVSSVCACVCVCQAQPLSKALESSGLGQGSSWSSQSFPQTSLTSTHILIHTLMHTYLQPSLIHRNSQPHTSQHRMGHATVTKVPTQACTAGRVSFRLCPLCLIRSSSHSLFSSLDLSVSAGCAAPQ